MSSPDALKERDRQLELYRRAINDIDDLIEYTPFDKHDIYEILERLSRALVVEPRFTVTDKGRELLKAAK
jgi:hypothetical protein